MSDLPTSDAPNGDEPKTRIRGKRVGKEQTKARLEAAIASGEMPPFCDNCGAIETPAWRRAYRKDYDCAWDEVDISSLDNSTCLYKEVTEQDSNGTIRAFKGYKITRTEEESDDEWKPITLCNRESFIKADVNSLTPSSLRLVVSQTKMHAATRKVDEEGSS